jgi:hypothetical protein
MQVVITEKDYEEALGVPDAKLLAAKKKEEVLGPEPNLAIIDALPRVLAERVRKMIPVDYEIREITIKVIISGTPFGVGVGGDATIKFGPQTSA